MKYLVCESSREERLFELQDDANVEVDPVDSQLKFRGKDIEQGTAGDFVVSTTYLPSWSIVDKPPKSFSKMLKKLGR